MIFHPYAQANATCKIFKLIMAFMFLSLVTSCFSVEHSSDAPYSPAKPYRQVAPVARDPYYEAPPAYPPSYGGVYQYPPASRYYSNPYASPPQNSYQYYDGDQYYRPPTAYGSGESAGGMGKY
jgi:hypothetical protein